MKEVFKNLLNKWMVIPRKRRRNISFAIMGIMAIAILNLTIKGMIALEEYSQEKFQKELNSFKFVEVYIKPGDTAYGLQSKLYPNRDVRELLYYASYKNEGVNLSNLRAGETIYLIEK